MNESPKNIIIANYSVHSLALICWAKKNLKNNFCVLSVDTGFASTDWDEYLSKVFIEVKQRPYSIIRKKYQSNVDE